MKREQHPNPGRSPDRLETRLRSVPPPRVPADLEARLLATIPTSAAVRRQVWLVWAGVVAAIAAAVLVALLVWPIRVGYNPALRNNSAPQGIARASDTTLTWPA